jgi:diguanylate cyclase (GGDEF)-like protein/PAS domain S-box-containing protein
MNGREVVSWHLVAPVSRAGGSLMTRAWNRYLFAGIPLAVLYFYLPAETAKLVVWPIIGWSSVVAIVVGVRRNRPESPMAWYLLAAGVSTLIVGDNMYTFRSIVQRADTLFPSYVDVVYLAMYPLLIAGLALLVHRRTAGRDRVGLIDATIVTVGVGLVSWVLLIAPYVRIGGLPVIERLASLAYPIGDVALLAVAARWAVGGGRRPTAFWLLAGGLVSLLASDGLYGYLNLAGSWHEHNPVDFGWIAFYFGWGAAALHPSMRELSIATVNSRRISTGRLVVIGSAVLVPPAMLFIEEQFGRLTNATAIAGAGAILFTLVLIRIAGLARDAADEKSEARFRALVDNASDAVVVLDVEGRVRYQTPSTARVLGAMAKDLEGRRFVDLLDEADKEHFVVMLANPSATATFEWRIDGGDGERRDLDVIAADMRRTAHIDGVVLTMRDITDRKHLDLELRRQALHDSLTDLPNRTLFLDRIEQALERAERTRDSVAVLVFDLDDFKVINDGLGHAAGDDLLIAVAARLTTAKQPGDTLARLGGDEFALLLENADAVITPGLAALNLQAALHTPFLLRDEEVPVSCSIGMAVGSPATHTPADLLRHADLAMYVAKRTGKNRFEQYLPAMHEEASHRLEFTAELRNAIEHGELAVFYQPIVELSTGRICGVEALVRWLHPQRGLLQPSEFIPVAELTGLIIPIGQWVLRDACQQTQQWKDSQLANESFYTSVNLSARHVIGDNVLDDVRTALADSGLPPKALVIEVTESVLIEDLAPASSKLGALRRLGLRIAVDDFGTGYSSLAYLGSLPVDVIKIDKSFTDRVAINLEGETIVRAVVDLAHNLGHTTIAEGVEHSDQAAALQRLGCRLAQGFLFARPMPADDMGALLARQSIDSLKTST